MARGRTVLKVRAGVQWPALYAFVSGVQDGGTLSAYLSGPGLPSPFFLWACRLLVTLHTWNWGHKASSLCSRWGCGYLRLSRWLLAPHNPALCPLGVDGVGLTLLVLGEWSHLETFLCFLVGRQQHKLTGVTGAAE